MSCYSFLLSISFRKLEDRSHNSNPTALRILCKRISHYIVLLGFVYLSEKFQRHNRRLPATQSWKTLGLPLHLRMVVQAGQASTLPHIALRQRRQCRPSAVPRQATVWFHPRIIVWNILEVSMRNYLQGNFWKPPGPKPVIEMVQSRHAPAFVRYCCRSETLQTIRRDHLLPKTCDQFNTRDATHTPWAGIWLVCYAAFEGSATLYIPSFVKTGSGIQQLLGRKHRNTGSSANKPNLGK
jgi:hypothetical protein